MTFAIRFDFPEGATVYAGKHKGALGWAPSLTTAMLFVDEEEAHRYLAHGYGAAARYGRVVEVKSGGVVA